MNLGMFNACVAGYSMRLVDQQKLAAQQGYWAGYYSRSSKPKSLTSILNKMDQTQDSKHKQQHVDVVDVETFLKREANFREQGGEIVGN